MKKYDRVLVSYTHFGPEFGPKRFSKFGPNPAREARTDLQLWSAGMVFYISCFLLLLINLSIFNCFIIVTVTGFHWNFRSVSWTSAMMLKAMSKRIKATILYATETGKSQMYAEQLKEILNFAFNAKVQNAQSRKYIKNVSLVHSFH